MNKNEIVLEIVLAMIEHNKVLMSGGNNADAAANGAVVSDLYNAIYDSIKSE